MRNRTWTGEEVEGVRDGLHSRYLARTMARATAGGGRETSADVDAVVKVSS